MRCTRRLFLITLLIAQVGGMHVLHAAEPSPNRKPTAEQASQVMAMLKIRCGKCHGPADPKAGLLLMTPAGVVRGGESGPIIASGSLEESSLWTRVDDEEMPPESPLSAKEKLLLKSWIENGAPGLKQLAADGENHWAFQKLQRVEPPGVKARGVLDRFVVARLQDKGLSLNAEADRATLIRRVSFNLTGLPPTPAEITRFLSDPKEGAYEEMVNRYLASPHYGERWGKKWLDTAGYADSNGYFNADTDRPLAHRYRDYVIRSFNADKPFDQFVREQLAGDELAERAGYDAEKGQMGVKREIIALLEATHFLRNAPDGTDSSDGNPDEVRIDKYRSLEGAQQIIGSALLGLKLQCARCHDHKFEPIPQQDYYELQAILYPAFNIEKWAKPKDRFVFAAPAAEVVAWEKAMAQLKLQIVALQQEYNQWKNDNPPPGVVLFQDAFEVSPSASKNNPVLARWTNTAPGDEQPAGAPAVVIGGEAAPAVTVADHALHLLASTAAGDRAVSTTASLDWTPNQKGDWIHASFELVADHIGQSPPAARIAYFIALADFNDRENGPSRGNVLIDGKPSGGAAVHLDYPGADAQTKGVIGAQNYSAGHRYGVRITNTGNDAFLLEHLVDEVVEGKSLTLSGRELPDGGFGFELCCGRSFVVDNVQITATDQAVAPEQRAARVKEQRARQDTFEKALAELQSRKTERPGKLAWTTDLSPTPPEVFFLERGDYKARMKKVGPGVFSALTEKSNPYDVALAASTLQHSTGRRLALARWLTRRDSKAAALLARVTVNRIWQHHFGVGIVATSDNMGYSGDAPSHPELLEWLASAFIGERLQDRAAETAGALHASAGWSVKRLHRLILNSAAYRQSSAPYAAGQQADPENRLLWRFPLQRLDAESIRDAMLALSGELDSKMGGPYVATHRLNPAEVVVDEQSTGARRRSVYLQSRRTQTPSLLEVFDAPAIVFNCTRRDSTTAPLQSLTLLNSDFCRLRARAFAQRLQKEVSMSPNAASTAARIARAYVLIFAREPSVKETEACRLFLTQQSVAYGEGEEGREKAWTDFCQSLMVSNAFLYVE